MNIVHAILESSPATHLVAASTAEIYGWQPKEPIREDAKFNPSSPYGVSKAAADSYIQMAMKVYGLKGTVFRCNNTYGRVGETGYLVEYIISQMLKNQTVYIGTPAHIRDYMFIDDHVDAYMRALKNNELIGEVFNVPPGNAVSNLDLARGIAKIMNVHGHIVEGGLSSRIPT